MSLYTIGPLFGPAIGPVAGGFLVQSVGVKWVFIVTACGSNLQDVVLLPAG
jgi:MFS family permease